MPLSMYQASVPVSVRFLNNLSAVLKKGEEFAAAKKVEEAVFINARLAPDMFPLSRQVQIATDIVRRGAARLAGIEAPSYEDNEASFADLHKRIEKSVAFLNGLKAEQIDGTEEKTVSLKVGGQDMTFSGRDYLLGFVLPNLFFHVTTAYDILRHNGAELGKRDFLAGGDAAVKSLAA